MAYLRYATFALILVIGLCGPAYGDQIDGRWCSPKGLSIEVDGAKVTTPGGNTVVANYDRHHIDYEIPVGEPNAGGRFSADQLNDEEISVTILSKSGEATGNAEIWTPCKPIS